MAALDRRNPNLEDFVGLNWSCWADRVNISSSDAEANPEDEGRCGMKRFETMTLGKEDMHIYGYCPAHDDFYLVVCDHCGQVVKPQAFEKHCERRHAAVIKPCDQSPAPAPQLKPCPGQKDERRHEGGGVQPHRTNKETVGLSSVKNPDKNPPLPLHSSTTPSLKVSSCLSGPLPPGDGSSSSVQKSSTGQSEAHCPLRGMRTYSRIYKNINKKECELNKHNKVLHPERKKLSSRELICNNDSIHQQQKFIGKLKTIDQLAVEQRTEQLLVKSKHKEKHVETLEEKVTTQGNKYNFSNNCHILRSTNPSENLSEEEGNGTVEVEVHPPYPFNHSLLPSDDSEEEEQDEAAHLSATPWHPKPLGLCTFGCRTFDCSVFTFDRRSYHLRFALSAMLERHVSAHLWKKMPQVSSGLRSRYVKPQTDAAVRTLDKSSKPTGSHSLESTSPGQLATKSSQQTFHSTKPPYSTDSTDRQSKAQLKEVELMQNASTAPKVRYTKVLHSKEDKSSRYIRDPPLHEKAQPHTPPSQRPASGTLSLRKKPCPPPSQRPSERQMSDLEKCFPASTHSRTKPQGVKQKAVGSDRRSVAQKRKGNNDPLSLSSSLSRASKYKRLSSPSHSGLVSWKGENIQDMLSWGLEKRSDP